MRKFFVLAAALILWGTSSPASAEYGNHTYHYCFIDDGDTYYYSGIFAVKWDAPNSNMYSAFYDFVKARFNSKPAIERRCTGSYETAQGAGDEMNKHIARARDLGRHIEMTDWRYHGD